MIKKIAFWLPALLLFSCTTDDDSAPTEPVTDPKIIVVNEGAFGAQNASLTIIDLSEASTQNNAYANANENATLGSTLQSITAYGDALYMAVSNSSKILIASKSTLILDREILGLEAPRYIQIISGSKAYVSDFTADGIHIINPTTATYSGFIETSTWVDKMIIKDEILWISNPESNRVFRFDTAVDAPLDTLVLSAGASDLEIDANGNIWVLCQGTFIEPVVEPSLFKLDGATGAVLSNFDFPAGTGFGGTLRISGDGQTLFYLMGNNLFGMDIDAIALPTEPVVNGDTRSLYGLAIHPSQNILAVTDATDFSQVGQVYFYDFNGTALYDFETGVVPRDVLWLD